MQVFRGKNVMCIGTQMSATSNRANSTSTHISATFWPVQIGVKHGAVRLENQAQTPFLVPIL